MMLFPDDVTDEELALAAATYDHDVCYRPPPDDGAAAAARKEDAADDATLVVSPLEKWRQGYLWVSHLVAQQWCEQQMEYGFSRPEEAAEEPQHVIRGTELHLARELQTADYVDISVESDEDIFAVKVLNLYSHLSQIENVKICREVPIFGWVNGLFLMGKIDEIRWKAGDLEISEFKTRTKPFLPGKAQLDTHKLQVIIYKYLLSKLHCIDVDRLCSTLRLSKGKKLGSDVVKNCPPGIKCIQDLMDLLQSLGPLHNLKKLVIDYSCQDVDKVFASFKVDYDENWMLQIIVRCEEYWTGQRTAQGVDIEDAWKCSMCNFAENCAWRLAKVKEAQKSSQM